MAQREEDLRTTTTTSTTAPTTPAPTSTAPVPPAPPLPPTPPPPAQRGPAPRPPAPRLGARPASTPTTPTGTIDTSSSSSSSASPSPTDFKRAVALVRLMQQIADEYGREPTDETLLHLTFVSNKLRKLDSATREAALDHVTKSSAGKGASPAVSASVQPASSTASTEALTTTTTTATTTTTSTTSTTATTTTTTDVASGTGEGPTRQSDAHWDGPKWVTDDYLEDAPATIICSMAEGKIGSVYNDDGRIRTVHDHGPERADHSRETIRRFNVDRKLAWDAFTGKFNEDAWKDFQRMSKAQIGDIFQAWKQAQLAGLTERELPRWIKAVKGPDTALEPDEQGLVAAEMQLIEIFTKVGYLNWHPSRGAAVQFKANKQIVSVLDAAIKFIDEDLPIPEPPKRKQGATAQDFQTALKDYETARMEVAAARNRAFYKFVKGRLPDFVEYLRDPDAAE
jgi:hypothetical protein